MINAQYVVDVFTEKTVDTKFPENTFHCSTVKEVDKIVQDCSREISGIVKIEIWINHEEDKSSNV